MAISLTDSADMTSVANAIRSKTGGTAQLEFPDEFVSAIQSIPVGADLQEKTVSPATTAVEVLPDSGYDGMSKVTVNAMPAGSVGTPYDETTLSPTLHRKAFQPKVAIGAGYVSGGTYAGNIQYVYASDLTSGTLDITANGTYNVANYASVDVDTSSPVVLQNKTVSPSLSEQQVTADSGYTGLGTVTVNAMEEGTEGTPTATKSISGTTATVTPSVTNTEGYIEGGTHTGTAVTVNVTELATSRSSSDMTVAMDSAKATITAPAGYYASDGVKEMLKVTPSDDISLNTTTGAVTSHFVIPSSGYVPSYTNTRSVQLNTQVAATITPTESEQVAVAADRYTLGDVKVAAIDDEYIGSAVPRKSSTDMTVTGAVVTAPAGYYANDAMASVDTVTKPSITMGLNSTTGGVSASYTFPSAGYVSAGTTTNSLQLDTQAAKTVTPANYEQTAVAAGKYTTGAIKVAAIPAGSAGTPTITKDISGTTATLTPSVTNGTGYITGSTITGDEVTVDVTELAESRTSADMTVSGNTVTAPSGYYAANSSKSLPVSTSGTISMSLNTTTGKVTGSLANPAGYYNAWSDTQTLQLTTQAGTTIVPTEEEQTAVAAGKYTLGDIKVAAIDDEYVGSAIPRKSSTDMTINANTVSAPAGYYSASASKSLPIQTSPTINMSLNSTNGKVTASAAASSGYYNAWSDTETIQLDTVTGTTIDPLEAEQVAVGAGNYTLGDVKIGAISSTYVGSDIARRDSSDMTISANIVTAPAGYYSSASSKTLSVQTAPTVSLGMNTTTGKITASTSGQAGYYRSWTDTDNIQLTTQGATTITPTTTSQVAVAANTYTTGVVEVQGSAGLLPENIVKNTDIFGVIGTAVEAKYVTLRCYRGNYQLMMNVYNSTYDSYFPTLLDAFNDISGTTGVAYKEYRVLWNAQVTFLVTGSYYTATLSGVVVDATKAHNATSLTSTATFLNSEWAINVLRITGDTPSIKYG